MTTLKWTAFVLGGQPCGEQDRLVALFGRESGLCRVRAPGALKARNRLGGLLEPMTLGAFHLSRHREHSMPVLVRGDLLMTPFAVTSRPRGLLVFSLIRETLERFLPEHQPQPRTFRLVERLVVAALGGESLAGLGLYHLVWMLRLEGWLFDLEHCCRCGTVLEEDEETLLRGDGVGLLCLSCRRGEGEGLGILSSVARRFWRESRSCPPEGLERWGLTPRDWLSAYGAAVSLLEWHGDLRLQSAGLLRGPGGLTELQ